MRLKALRFFFVLSCTFLYFLVLFHSSAFASEVPCTETADTEPHPLRPAPARPCQKEPPKWNLSCANDAKPTLEVELPRTLDDTFNCSNTGDIGRKHCSRIIEEYQAPPVEMSFDLTEMALPVMGIASNPVADSLSPGFKMTNYTSPYLPGVNESSSLSPAAAVATYMNSVIALTDGVSNLKLLSPAFNISSNKTPQFFKDMEAANANFAGLDGFSGNTYTVSGRRALDWYTDFLKANVAHYGKKIIFTEFGDFETFSTVIDNRSQLIQAMKQELRRSVGDSTVESAIYFNAFGGNPQFIGHKLSDAELQTIISGNTGRAGVNSAMGVDGGGGFINHIAQNGAKWSLEIAFSPSDKDSVISAFNLALGKGIKPILRICSGNTCAFKDPAVYADFLKSIAAGLNQGDKTFWAIAGPNEPESELWVSGEGNGNQEEGLRPFAGPITNLIPKQVLDHYKEELIKSVSSGKTYDQIIGFVKDNKVIPRLEANKFFAENAGRTDIQKIRLSDMSGHISPPPGSYWYNLWLQTPFTASDNPDDIKGQVDSAGEFFVTPCLKNGRKCQSDPTVLDASLKILSGTGSFRIFFPHLIENKLLLENMLQAAFIPKSIPNSSPQPEYPLLQANLNKADRDPEWTVSSSFKNADGCVKSDSFTNPGDSLEAKQNKNQGIIKGIFNFKKYIEYNFDVDTAESLGYISACRQKLRTGEESGCPSPLSPIVKWKIDAPVPAFVRYPDYMDKIPDLTVRSPGGIFQALYPEIEKTIGDKFKDRPGATDISYTCTSSVPCTGGTSKAYFPWLGSIFDFFHKKTQEMLTPIFGSGTNSSSSQSDSSTLGTDFLQKNYPSNLLRQIVIPSAKKIADLLQQISAWQTQPGNTWVNSKFEQNYQKIIDFGIANNINPTLLLSLYLEETHGEAAGTYPLGCGNATTLDGSLNCIAKDPAIDEYRDAPLPEFLCRYADGHYPCDYSAHPYFIRNLMDFYDQLAP
jgi:hypothetical protein